jgi:hypothetical protein
MALSGKRRRAWAARDELVSASRQLDEFRSLYRQGAITKEEFNRLRGSLFGYKERRAPSPQVKPTTPELNPYAPHDDYLGIWGTSDATGDEPQDEMSAMRAADGAGELIIGYPILKTHAGRATLQLASRWLEAPDRSTGPQTDNGRGKMIVADVPTRTSLRPTTSFSRGGDDPRGKVQISLANSRAHSSVRLARRAAQFGQTGPSGP